VDYEVRWCILKLADILIRPVEETPPTIRLHIPPTPVSEIPPSLPSAKIAVKPPKPSIKTAVPPIKTSVPVNLKLPPKESRSVTSSANTPQPTNPSLPRDERTSHPPRPVLTPGLKIKPKGRPPKVVAPNAQNLHKDKERDKDRDKSKSQDKVICRNALKKLTGNKHSRWFLKPVDPVRDQAPR